MDMSRRHSRPPTNTPTTTTTHATLNQPFNPRPPHANQPFHSTPQAPARRASVLDANHDDLIHDLQFDFYGSRLVTASSDQMLKVWDWCASTQAWTLNDEWKAHEASIVRVAFGHPDYGHLLASCSYDRTVRIWEELDQEPTGVAKRWFERARLVDSRAAVTDIAFSPIHLGLKLATASLDGTIRIYEAMDVVNLAHWTLMDEFEIYSDAKESNGTLCLSWCKSKHPFHLLLPKPVLDTTRIHSAMPPSSTPTAIPGSPVALGASASMIPTAILAVGCGRENQARLYYHDPKMNRWCPGDILTGHTGLVHDISWAPGMGRSYQLIATACCDGIVRIYRLASMMSPLLTHPLPPSSPDVSASSKKIAPAKPSSSRFPPGSLPAHALNAFAAVAANSASTLSRSLAPDTNNQTKPEHSPHLTLVASINDHENQVWRVQWNITGTVLSSAGDDGVVRLFRAMGSAATQWTCISLIRSEKT